MPVQATSPDETAALAARVTTLEGKVAALEDSTPPPATGTSPFGTVVLPGGGKIIDNLGHEWTLNTGGRIARDGAIDNNSSAVIRLGWYDGNKLWQENSGHRCWSTPPVWPTTWTPTGGVAVNQSPFPQANSTSRAFDFVDSVGVNTHLGWTGTEYCNGPLVLRMLQDIGVRHVRDYPPTGWKQESDAALNLLASNGVKFDMIYGATGTASDLNVSVPTDINETVKFLNAHPSALVSMEGPNELNGQEVLLNGQSSTNPQVGAAIQQFCAARTRGNGAMQAAGVKMMNLSITNGRDGWSEYTNALGDLSAYCDQANWHVYFWQGIQPRYNATYMIDDAHRSAPGKPVVFTESGYPTSYESDMGVDPITAAKNTLNLLADAWQMGVIRTYLYQLQDPHANPGAGDTEAQFGLCNSNGSLKPAGVAVRNLLSILRDNASNAATFYPEALAYTIDNMPNTAYSFVVQKANGTFDILIWNEAVNWNANANQPIPVAPVNIVVKLPAGFTVHTFDPVSNTTSKAVGSVSTVPLSLSDHMIVVELQ